MLSEEAFMGNHVIEIIYGSIVTEMLGESKGVEEVNRALKETGFEIGERILDEYAQKNSIKGCKSFKDVGEKVVEAFLKIQGTRSTFSNFELQEFVIQFEENPMMTFIELETLPTGLEYSSIYNGMLEGALSSLNYDTTSSLTTNIKGPSETPGMTLKVTLNGIIKRKLINYDD